MNMKGGRWLWRVAAMVLLLAGPGCLFACWKGAVPPAPNELLSELQRQHGIDLCQRRRDADWDYDRITTEWACLALSRGTPQSPSDTPRSFHVRGWECMLRSPEQVDAGAMVLGSGTIAFGSGSTLTRKMPDGRFECEVRAGEIEGPWTFLLVAIPTGRIERLRYNVR